MLTCRFDYVLQWGRFKTFFMKFMHSSYMDKTIDLHVQFYLSDGTFTPEERTVLVGHAGLSAFAPTAHDTTAGIGRALQAVASVGMEVIPGIGFSTRWQSRDIHILGYYMDYHAPSF